MYTDPIADYLTRIRNAAKARHVAVSMPYSRLKEQISRVLRDSNFIRGYRVEEADPQRVLTLLLKYKRDKQSVISSIRRVSTPGLRHYVGVQDMPRVLNGLGIAVLSTSRGVVTGKEAIRLNVGGEVLCEVC